MSSILWRRLAYMLSPQADLYQALAPRLCNQSILEIGFGTGFGVLHYADKARHITAIETDEDAVAFAQNHLHIGNTDWMLGDVLTHEFDTRFDSAVMIEVLEHIGDWRRALSRLNKLLVSGGKLYISARNANADLRRNELHEREWTAQELKEALELYFKSVTLYDYKMQDEQTDTTRQTPLLAVAVKE